MMENYLFRRFGRFATGFLTLFWEPLGVEDEGKRKLPSQLGDASCVNACIRNAADIPPPLLSHHTPPSSFPPFKMRFVVLSLFCAAATAVQLRGRVPSDGATLSAAAAPTVGAATSGSLESANAAAKGTLAADSAAEATSTGTKSSVYAKIASLIDQLVEFISAEEGRVDAAHAVDLAKTLKTKEVRG